MWKNPGISNIYVKISKRLLLNSDKTSKTNIYSENSIKKYRNWRKKILLSKIILSILPFFISLSPLYTVEKAGVAVNTASESESGQDSSEFMRDMESSKEPENKKKRKSQAVGLTNDQIQKKKEIIEKIESDWTLADNSEFPDTGFLLKPVYS